MVYDSVVKIIADNLGIEESAINTDSLLVEDLCIDSLDFVDLCMAFEDEFGLEIPDDMVENIKTVGDIVKYIEDNQPDNK